jgi:hypothetical protein
MLKMAVTTILAALITALIVWLVDSGFIHLRPQA